MLAAILFAAFLHAAWNAGLKSQPDTFMAALAVTVIAAYTLVDGLGVRRSGAPAAYTAWMFLLTGIGIAALSWRRSAGLVALGAAAVRLA